ncbi:hypothetical protein F5B17DRAFT_429974 [Nemania serpens]|nr:hypothetical protein F5B17DRAFT_429974 [Nemania serpens]
MSPSGLKNRFAKKTMTKKALLKLTEILSSAYNCVDRFEALEEKRGYNIGKELPAHLFKRGIEYQLLEHWNDAPRDHELWSDGNNIAAGLVGCEWAAYLRVRNPEAIILRVDPKNRTARADRLLCELLSSLITNIATLVPAEFDIFPGLCRDNFELLARGGARGIDAGCMILEALPRLELHGTRFLCVLDALNLAELGGQADAVRQLKGVLRIVLARNRGHLLYTLARTR